MSGRVLLLSRAQPLGAVRLGLVVMTLVGSGLMINGVLFREGVFDLSKDGKLDSLYSMFAGAVIYLALVVSCMGTLVTSISGSKGRLDDFERSLPASEQDWLRAELWSLLRVVLLAFAGAVLGHLIGVLRGMPAATLSKAIAPCGIAMIAVSVGCLLRGNQARTSVLRLLAILMTMIAPLSLLIVDPEAAKLIAYGAPLVVLAAWTMLPKRLLPNVRTQAAPTMHPVGEGLSVVAAATVTTPDADRENGFHTALVQMRLALTVRSGGWWVEALSLAAVSSAVFIYPVWPLGVGIAFLMIFMARPSLVDERVLQPLRHLPFPRRSLFPVVGIKAVLVPSLAIMAVGMGNSWSASEVDRVSLTSNWDELRRARGLAEYPKIPNVVMVPAEDWSIAFSDAPIPVSLPDGETLVIRPRRAFPGVYVYHQFQLPDNCSVKTASEQIARAKRHYHGGDVSAEQIAEGLTLSTEFGVRRIRGHSNDFSGRNRHYRRSMLGRWVDAPFYFLPIFGLMAVAVLRRYRVRQLPARKLYGLRILGRIAIVYAAIGGAWLFMSASGSDHSQIAIKSMCAAVRSVVPAWALFALCGAAVWWLWQACAKRFEQMEAPPAIPGVPQN